MRKTSITTSSPEFLIKFRVLDNWFRNNRESLNLESKYDLMVSDHAVERMLERGLDKDKTFVLAICKWFMANVFYGTTYNSRTYQVSLRGLKCIFYISPGKISGSRFAILKTVFESSDDYEVDEKVDLK